MKEKHAMDDSTEAPVCDACRSFPNRRRVDGRPASCSMRSSTSTTQPARRRDGLLGLAATASGSVAVFEGTSIPHPRERVDRHRCP
jgi:hypothetical protein